MRARLKSGTRERIDEIKKAGSGTSAVEVTDISQHGLWMFVEGSEYFLPFDDFPRFRAAGIDDIMNVSLLHSHHLRWETLDIDLELESLSDPELAACRNLAAMGGTEPAFKPVRRRRRCG